MKIVHAEERSEIDIQISEIVKDGGILNILPSVKNYFSIDYKPKNDKLSLVAGGYIGLIPINRDLAIEIRPKFSVSNLTRIVSIAEDKFKTLNFFRKKYSETDDPAPAVFEFMVQSLVNEIQTIEEEGLLKEYLLRNENTQKIRGRINVNDSIKALWGHGNFHKASVSYYDLTPDNSLNQLIKYTLKFCIEELNHINLDHTPLKKSLIAYYSMFARVHLVKDAEYIYGILDSLSYDKYPASINLSGSASIILAG